MTLLQSGIAKPSSGYDIEQSLRFDDGDSAYLNRTPGSASNQKTWTWSCWVKRSNLGAYTNFFDAHTDNNNRFYLAFNASDKLEIYGTNSASNVLVLTTTAVYRDCSAFYHIVFQCDTTQASSSNRAKLYVNGEQVTAFDTATYPAQDTDLHVNSTAVHRISSYAGTSNYLDGYLAEVHFIDGTALDASSFGETDSATNQWVPIEVTGMTYGTNGFYLPFSSTELANSFTDSSKDFASDTFPLTADYLIVAGGGGGASSSSTSLVDSGGGGAGGYRYFTSQSIAKGSYSITVGAGGAQQSSNASQGNDGGNSSAFGNSATGGGGGGARSGTTTGRPGGSGGGAAGYTVSAGGSGNAGGYSPVEGYAGATSISGNYNAGGGGGSSGAGSVSSGGSGTSNSITGSAVTYAAGGNGGGSTSAATANTGNGGDGGNGNDSSTVAGAAGGSGVVIIRYASANPLGSGGTITSYTDGGTTYQVHTFTSNGTFIAGGHTITANGDVTNTRTPLYKIDTFTSDGSWTKPSGVTSFDVLVVAGGGSGGRHGGSGGGAGGLIYAENYTIPDGTYSITIGSGGTGATGTSNTAGGDSSIGSLLVAKGGGKGVNTGNTVSGSPFTGGSGAGGGNGSTSGFAATQPSQSGDSGTYGFGNSGGDGLSSGDFQGGGGGGAGAAGSNAPSSTRGGDGGSGKTLSISGSSVTYAGGGGGASHVDSGGSSSSGGSGGGGAGNSSHGSNGGDATGYGSGGGGGGKDGTRGGNGSAGIVIIRYIEAKPGSSSIKFDGTGDYLSIPDSTDFDFDTNDFTVECWANGDINTSDYQGIIGNWYGSQSNYSFDMRPMSADKGGRFTFAYNAQGNTNTIVDSGFSLTDDTWHHLAVSRSSTNLYMFVDGDLKHTHTIGTTELNNPSNNIIIGNTDNTWYWDGYVDEIRISDTARYTSSFTPSTTAFTADANTLLLIHSDFNGGIGADNSGNTNDFSATNLVATDVLTDTPTNNGATWNPLANKLLGTTRYAAYAQGNRLTYQHPSASNTARTPLTMSIPNGAKKHIEFDLTVNGQYPFIMLLTPDAFAGAPGDAGYLVSQPCTSGSGATVGLASGASNVYPTTGDRITWEIDNQNGRIYVWKNGVAQNSADPGAGTGYTYEYTVPTEDAFICTTGNTSSRITVNPLEGDFDDSVTTGYIDFSTSSMDDPSIADPTKHFNTVLYSGDGTSSRTITGVGFQPDLMWLKARNQSSYNRLHDSVRGGDGSRMYVLGSNLTAAESTDTSILSLASDGFTTDNNAGTGGGNASGDNYVSWNWKAGGTASSNTDGSITSSVSANTTAGFSIVAYTGTGSNDGSDTVGHGLSQAPELYVIKNRDSATDNWNLYTAPTGTGNYMYLDGTAASASASNGFQYNTAPTASVFTLGTWDAVNKLNDNYIAYCFHSVDGYSKVGSYTGNSNADGPMFYCGFKPSWAMFKAIDSAQSWTVFDNKRNVYNLMDNSLFPDLSNAENDATSLSIDFVSNGIKIRSTHNYVNYSGSDYLVLAFAESPFKTSNAR